MNRREFLSLTAAAAPLAAPRWWSRGIPAPWADRIDRIGLQLYTVRDAMRFSVEKTLHEVSEIGYREVEFAGYFGRPALAIRQLLDRNGLKSPSAHISLDTLKSGWFRTLNDASEIGQKWLVIASLAESDRNSLDAIKRTADQLNRSAADAKTFKIRLGYHNHAVEFQEVEGKRIFDVLLDETDPELVQFELDLYWITKGGGDPLDYFARYPGRFPMVHVKDAGPAPDYAMTEVGKGTIDWARIFAHHKEARIEHYYVEHDNPGDAMASIATSFRYLKSLEF